MINLSWTIRIVLTPVQELQYKQNISSPKHNFAFLHLIKLLTKNNTTPLILSKLPSGHSAVRDRMNEILFCSFRKQNRSQANLNAVYSMHPYPRIARLLPNKNFKELGAQPVLMLLKVPKAISWVPQVTLLLP